MLSVTKLSLSVLPLETDHSAFEPVQGSLQLLNKAILDLSHLTKGLHSDRITQVGLTESIRFEIYALRKAGILQANFHQEGDEIEFGEQKSIFLFRIFQESLNNILKHAQATEVNVSLVYAESLFTLEINDNGIGFSVEEKTQKASASAGVGLKSLFNRAKLIGADMSMTSTPGKGTTILIELPLTTT
ncbi:MAG: hypothetical protein EOO00_00990 [Chitinophagaceae bacterium]|nr:MAG: hypothetical protein EOO00_00990 [Chitinophagaceae bacterium]